MKTEEPRPPDEWMETKLIAFFDLVGALAEKLTGIAPVVQVGNKRNDVRIFPETEPVRWEKNSCARGVEISPPSAAEGSRSTPNPPHASPRDTPSESPPNDPQLAKAPC